MLGQYHFVTQWRLPGTCERLYNLLEDIPTLQRYWPSLYKEARVLSEKNENDVGKTVAVVTKGFLPYLIHWNFRVTEVHHFSGFSLEAWGDLKGDGRWEFEQVGDEVRATYHWNVSIEKPLLKYFSFLLRPILSANHTWVMEQGRKGIEQALKHH